MFGHLCDPDLPALQGLARSDLARITGAAQTRLLRARYQPGARAILHVALGGQPGADEGAIWFYAGHKAEKLARRWPDARLDAASGALFQAFPQDHRMPLLATFVNDAMGLAPRLMGGPAADPPELMRYRPGLSATFRWTRDDGQIFYVKQTPEDDVTAQALAVSHLAEAAKRRPVAVAPVAGIVPELGLIAYATAPGKSLDTLLSGQDALFTQVALEQVAGALRALWSLSVLPARVMDRAALLLQAEQARRMIALLDPDAGRDAAKLVAGLQACAVAVRLRPIHADMKLEHAFLSGPRTTLIDIESLSLGEPDHDLAKLEARTHMALLTGRITEAQADAAQIEIRRHAGPHYDWFLTCARLQCAKFFAQRFDPATIPLMRQVLAAC